MAKKKTINRRKKTINLGQANVDQMTIRMSLAQSAMQGLLANPEWVAKPDKEIVKRALSITKVMLSEFRHKHGGATKKTIES